MFKIRVTKINLINKSNSLSPSLPPSELEHSLLYLTLNGNCCSITLRGTAQHRPLEMLRLRLRPHRSRRCYASNYPAIVLTLEPSTSISVLQPASNIVSNTSDVSPVSIIIINNEDILHFCYSHSVTVHAMSKVIVVLRQCNNCKCQILTKLPQ